MQEILTEKERRWFDDKVNELRPKLNAEIADIDMTSLYWEDEYNEDNGIMGSFNHFQPDRVKLNPTGKLMPEFIIGTLVHELHHKWQFEKYGRVLFVLLAIPGLRRLTIEPSAYRLEDQVDELMGQGGLRR